MGGTQADPNNQRANYIVFEPGSTLVVTQIGTSASIWASLVATNGEAFVECMNETANETHNPTFQLHVFAYGAGSLTLRNMMQPYVGNADSLSVYRLDNLKSVGVDPIAFANGVSVLTLPNQSDCPWVFGRNNNLVRLCGSDMFPNDDVINIDSGRCRLMLCNPAAIPAGKTVRVNGNKFLISPLRVPDPEEGIVGCYNGSSDSATVVSGMVYSCNVELPTDSRMTFTVSAPVTFDGSISGYNSGCGNIAITGFRGTSAPVALSGDNSGFTGQIFAETAGAELVLSNANAAVNATIDMATPMVVRGAEGVAEVSIGAVSGGTDLYTCVVRAAANQTISIASVSGCLRISGAGSGSVVDIGTLAPGAIVYDDKTAVVTYGGSSALPSGAVRGRTTGAAEFIVMQSDNSGFEAAKADCTAVSAFEVADGTLVTHGTNAVTVRAGAGVEASLAPAEGDVFSVSGEGSFAVEPLLRRTVSWWFDFSRADTRFRVGEGSTDAYLDREFASGQPFVERVVDWRFPGAANCLWNRRLYKDGGGYEFANTVYPYVAGTQNGLHYISMEGADSSRRLPFSNGRGANSVSSCAAKLVVMVFGAQRGGGWAMFGTTEGAFGRGEGSSYKITNVITTNAAHDVWQDGVKVNPASTYFKNGFQVMSVDVDGLHFNGLGFLKDIGVNPNRMGGQNYGEVLIFTNAVSTQMRLEAELYLARKWGLEAQYSPEAVAQLKALRAANPVRIAAAGCEATTIKAGGQTVSVEGSFTGTVELDGGTLVVQDKPLPYTESDIPSEGRLYWADPDDSETVWHTFDDPFYNNDVPRACSNELRTVQDKVRRAFVQGEPVLYAVGDRRPTPIRQSRGLGPTRTWLDFNDYAEPGNNGNCLRFISCPELSRAAFRNGGYSTLATMNVRTAFIVQDSIRGGGGPLLGDVGGAAYPKNRADGVWTQTIYPDNLPAVLVNGENRLNGNVVDYRNGFLGQPEVFTVRGTGTRNLPFIGCYQNTEKGKKNGEIIGEVLLYDTALSDADVKGIEAYLMGKWIGRLPEGYADIRNATVAGTGTVQVAVGSQRPNIDREFEGTVSIAAGGDFTMTIDPDTGTVMGALDCPAATLSLPASCSITVNLTRRPPSGMASCDYTLVDCASGADGVTWTLNSGANTTSRCRFVQTGNKVIFRYVRPGTSIVFR